MHITDRARSWWVAFLIAGFASMLFVGCTEIAPSPAEPTPDVDYLELHPVPSALASIVPEAAGEKPPVGPTASAVAYETAPGPQPEVFPTHTDENLQTAEAVQNAQATAGALRQNLPYPIQTNEATVVPATSILTDAWGSLAVAKVLPLDLDSDHLFVLHTVDPMARFVVGAIVPNVLGSEEPARLVTVDVDDGSTMEIARVMGPSAGDLAIDGTQAFASDTDGEWVVWNEYYAVRAYNLVSGATRLLDEEPQDGTPVSFDIPQVDRGVAIWAEKETKKDPYSSSRVMPATVKRADLTTGEVTTLSSYGAYPAISWPVVAWLEYPDERDGITEYSLDYNGTLTLLNFSTGEKWDLPQLTALAGVALHNDTLFFTTIFGQGFLTNLQGEHPRLVAPQFSSPFTRMAVGERLITWKFGVSTPIYDRTLDRQVGLAARYLGYPMIIVVRGNALAWQEVVNMVELSGQEPGYVVPGGQVVYVVDTTRLPN